MKVKALIPLKEEWILRVVGTVFQDYRPVESVTVQLFNLNFCLCMVEVSTVKREALRILREKPLGLEWQIEEVNG